MQVWAAEDADEPPETLAAAEVAARRDGRMHVLLEDGYAAMAQPVTGEDRAGLDIEVISVGRRGTPFTAEEQGLFGSAHHAAALKAAYTALLFAAQAMNTMAWAMASSPSGLPRRS